MENHQEHPHHQDYEYDTKHFIKSGIGGAICCTYTHMGTCPIDVIKTKIQIDPVKYPSNITSAFIQVAKTEGFRTLATGLSATAFGYGIQGLCKFGGTEFFKVKFANYLGDDVAWKNRTLIYLGASSIAEFTGDILLCPFEAIRIRSVSDSKFPRGVFGGFAEYIKTDGFAGLYAGIFPMLFKQIPYTVTQFVVQGKASELIYKSLKLDHHEVSYAIYLSISITAGLIAGVFAAITSHPADTLLSQINKKGAGGNGSTFSRLKNISMEMGFKKLCLTGLGPRIAMISVITAGQFGMFDTVMKVLGAKKYHFVDPDEKKH